MRTFVAILKDSYREAVDGFVVYAMLGLSALLILVAASMSFTPAEPDKAFGTIVRQFRVIVPEKGRSRAFADDGRNTFSTADVQPSGGGYKLRVLVKAQQIASGSVVGPNGLEPNLSKGDSFRAAVFQWRGATGDTVRIGVDEKGNPQIAKKGSKGKGVDFVLPTESTPDELRAVTDAQMEEFIKGQFVTHAGMSATVTRVPETEPSYVFDVTTTGGSAVQGWPHTAKIFFGTFTLDDESPLGATLWLVEDVVINRFGGTLALLVGMIITAFFIPNMLRKGSVDLFISKPIGRAQLLVYKYIGGLTFMFLVTAFTVGGIWFVLAVRSGYWNPSFLVAIPVLTFTFAVLYAISTLVATVTRSAVAAMLLSVGFAFFMFVFGQIKANYDERRANFPDRERPAWQATVVDGGNDALPRMRELDLIIRRAVADGTLTPPMKKVLVQSDEPAPLYATFGVSLLHIGWMLGVSCWWFSRRDY
ncbi:MAG: hypothetical protein FJ304_20780 [Planctomycetes bacterium]|nr:hypothetical protein [Planctomycetota bacterium]